MVEIVLPDGMSWDQSTKPPSFETFSTRFYEVARFTEKITVRNINEVRSLLIPKMESWRSHHGRKEEENHAIMTLLN